MANKRIVEYENLTPSQAKITNLPPTKNYVVTGAPGTGKTVVALYMAQKFVEQGMKVLFLVKNRPLMLFLRSQIGNNSGFEINTFDAWFRANSVQLCGKYFTSFDYDWTELKPILATKKTYFDYIIFDEAQDFPIELIESIKPLSKYMACFFDENQRLNDECLQEDDILEALGEKHTYTLEENYRNTKEIFEFAKAYSTKKQPDARNNTGSKPFLVEVPGYEQQNEALINIIKANTKAHTIGIFANTKSLTVTYDSINGKTDREVYVYKTKSKDYRDVDFSRDGVFILPYNCAKGLEFDVVILTMCDKIYLPYGSEDSDTLIYVATTRAKEKLYCIYNRLVSNPDKFINFFAPVIDTIDTLCEGTYDWNLKPKK